ncbi:Ppx/GppA phosphatase family protein [Streptomyces sp. KL118A]|uniref:Ppx/GppA phosphatase family protein n=1 Tax=Streptomyces sp. KL118A TaxID=3045153 RepID=UPI00278C8785|nr:Ppx/GppA phosphatase family protein [Streptomyces sp. KL118A]
MRVGVVDVGSNTVRLVVADADGQVPLPVHTVKRRLRLGEHLDDEGRLAEEPVRELVDAVRDVQEEAQRWGVVEPFAFCTSIVRDAPNRAEVLEAVEAGTGIRLRTLSGEAEAELTFLAARRWMGWRAGPLVLFDIGGGSLEVAFGRSRLPDYAASLPLGARRLTRDLFDGQDPPREEDLKAVRRQVRHQLRDVAARIRWEMPHTAVATSRTFQQLARLCGAAPGRYGPFVERQLGRVELGKALKELARLPAERRAQLPGISAARAGQCVAGAVVAHTAMKLTGIEEVTVCPWALREGILLRYIEDGDADWWAREHVHTGDANRTGSMLLPLTAETCAT